MADKEHWINRWESGNIPFHQSEVNRALIRFFPHPGPARVFLPLCGKTLDLAWLSPKVEEVVGLELVELAVESFFQDHHLDFQKRKERNFQLYQSKNIKIYQGDFFRLSPGIAGRFPFIFDRAALVAMPGELRPQYASHLLSFLEPEGKILLVSLEYEPASLGGPPFHVPEEEVNSLFSSLEVDLLLEEFPPELPPHLVEKGLKTMTSKVYLIKNCKGKKNDPKPE